MASSSLKCPSFHGQQRHTPEAIDSTPAAPGTGGCRSEDDATRDITFP